MLTRLAVAIGGLLLLGAALATFLPTSPDGSTCGTWVAPEWSASRTQDVVDRATQTEIDAEQVSRSDLAAQARAIGAGAERSQAVCADALGNRRNLALVLLGLAVAAPGLVLWVSGSGWSAARPRSSASLS
jgi:hypothetical protein